MGKIETIGILTSGGDAPGMNVAVRAVVRTALNNGLKVIGIRRGFQGLLNSDMFDMNLRSVSETIHRGGTILYSARCESFVQESVQKQAYGIAKDVGIDALVVIGGDGTFRGALALSRLGLPCVGIPATIDNDIASSDYTIGFDTAVNTVIQMVDRLRDTSQSHDRCSVVEVMGRNSGHIALHAGISCGALAILVPEIPFDLQQDVVEKMRRTLKTGKKHFIIMVAEGVGSAGELAKTIEKETGIQSRSTVLGHVQRGGSPTARERIMASQMGHQGVSLLISGAGSHVVVYREGVITSLPIEEALKMTKSIDLELYQVAGEISI